MELVESSDGVLVFVDEDARTNAASAASGHGRRLEESIQETLGPVKHFVEAIVSELGSLSLDEIEFEVALKWSSKASVFVVDASGSSQYRILCKWKRKDD